jgi:hypothetical protein
MEVGKRYAVFSIRTLKEGSVWSRAGSAFANKDGSVNIYLDVLPLDGKLHIREAANGVGAAERDLLAEEAEREGK